MKNIATGPSVEQASEKNLAVLTSLAQLNYESGNTALVLGSTASINSKY
jgi:hypothetical protein